jgi:alcohol dehydrogenase (cytochrome c)
MRRWKHALSPALLFLPFLPLCAASPLTAQDLENAQLLNPPPDSWPLYHCDYSGRRHIRLTQIAPRNVGDLTLAWALPDGKIGPNAMDSRHHYGLPTDFPLLPAVFR